jgi:hypothetical protein
MPAKAKKRMSGPRAPAGKKQMLSILSVDLIEALKIAAIEDGTKGSHIVEEAVRDWLAKRKLRRKRRKAPESSHVAKSA